MMSSILANAHIIIQSQGIHALKPLTFGPFIRSESHKDSLARTAQSVWIWVQMRCTLIQMRTVDSKLERLTLATTLFIHLPFSTEKIFYQRLVQSFQTFRYNDRTSNCVATFFNTGAFQRKQYQTDFVFSFFIKKIFEFGSK